MTDDYFSSVPTAADEDAYAETRETTEGTVYTVSGQDWDDVTGD